MSITRLIPQMFYIKVNVNLTVLCGKLVGYLIFSRQLSEADKLFIVFNMQLSLENTIRGPDQIRLFGPNLFHNEYY